jgi:hypothetical protein
MSENRLAKPIPTMLELIQPDRDLVKVEFGDNEFEASGSDDTVLLATFFVSKSTPVDSSGDEIVRGEFRERQSRLMMTSELYRKRH